MTTEYHAKYWAHALTRHGSDGIDSIGQSISNARINLNPYQVEAAIFALQSPLQKGVMLADEVGLGKTIEAGLVIAQRWAEQRRKILLILPATLRTQWRQELETKFFIPSIVLDSQNYKEIIKQGRSNPFEHPVADNKPHIIICSYQFAWKRANEISTVPWDLVVIDEAHRLRNVYKSESQSKQSRAIRQAIVNRSKLLLTATPLQNDLKELWGLASIADDTLFGDQTSELRCFSAQYKRPESHEDLRARLKSWCRRTLRRDVTDYVKFTKRHSLTEDFTPTEEEMEVYDRVTKYLERSMTWAFPKMHPKLKELVLRKLLASSTFAIGATLEKLRNRLEAAVSSKEAAEQYFNAVMGLHPEEDGSDDGANNLMNDVEAFIGDRDEYAVDDEENDEGSQPLTLEAAREQMMSELKELSDAALCSVNIQKNAKGEALLRVLGPAFEKAATYGAARKVVIFSESRKTQSYLNELLANNGYAGQIVLINGENADKGSQEIYASWLKRHSGSARSTGMKTVDIKSALVEEFKDRGTILLATESAAEGVNLQFCSLLINFDLPWNPQRVEQRIGRCHRYGQEHEVVVVNFINRANTAERRVFELLDKKFKLFDGVFGASDEILGVIESGVDIERRVLDIMSKCKTSAEIDAEFNRLQDESWDKIDTGLNEARRSVLDNLDEEVHSRLKMWDDETRINLDRRSQWLLDLTRFELGKAFHPDENEFSFRYLDDNRKDALQGSYYLLKSDEDRLAERDGTFYRPDDPLAQKVIRQAMDRALNPGELVFRISEHPTKISVIEELKRKSGWLALSKVSVTGVREEQGLLFVGIADDGGEITSETCLKMFSIPVENKGPVQNTSTPPGLAPLMERERTVFLNEVRQRNDELLMSEMDKLNRWADDQILALEQELKDLAETIKQKRTESKLTKSLAVKIEFERDIRDQEAKRAQLRKSLYKSQDDIEKRRNEKIDESARQIASTHSEQTLFTIRWSVV